MKKVGLILCCVFSLFVVLFSINQTSVAYSNYVRIHIRADSNSSVDQNIKYKIKDCVVSYLTPKISLCESREDFIVLIENNLENIERVADDVLRLNGFDYKSSAHFKKEEFPTRVYDDLTLESGVYDSLILNLGSGSGDNWWCVVYPPMCFVSSNSQNIMYKSKILDIINSILK